MSTKINYWKMSDGILANTGGAIPFAINGVGIFRSNGSWSFVEGVGEPFKATTIGSKKQVGSRWVLRDGIDLDLPKELSENDVRPWDDGEWRSMNEYRSLYEFQAIYEQVPPAPLDYEFVMVGEADASCKHPPPIRFVKAKERFGIGGREARPVADMPFRLMYPEPLHKHLPSSISGEDMYGIVREWVRRNIDRDVAKITSDYDFCFVVAKIVNIKPYYVRREVLTRRGNSYKPPRYTPVSIAKKEITCFSMRPNGRHDYDYAIMEPVAAPTQDELVQKIQSYLDELMENINRPLSYCKCCDGLGVEMESGE